MAWETLGTVADRLLKRLQTLQANENERKKPRLRLVTQPGRCAAPGRDEGALDGAPHGGSKREAGEAGGKTSPADRRSGVVLVR